MADPSGAAATQAADAAQPQAGTTDPATPDAATTPEAPDAAAEGQAPLDAAALRSELERTRREAAKNRTELKKAQDEIKAAADAKLSDEEKRTARIAELEKQITDKDAALKERVTFAAVVDAAARMGATKPQLIHRLLDTGAIEYDSDGAPTNVDALVKDFMAVNPEFRSAATRASGSADGGARPGASALTRAEIDKMSMDEQQKRWPEIEAFMAAQSR